MPDCWRFMYPVSYGLQKHSLFKNALDSKILFIREGGFVGKWFNDELSVIGINEKKELRDGKLTMTAMKVPHIFLIMCLIVVFFVWLGEWGWYKRNQAKARKLRLTEGAPQITMSDRRRRSNNNYSVYLSKVKALYQRSDSTVPK